MSSYEQLCPLDITRQFGNEIKNINFEDKKCEF